MDDTFHKHWLIIGDSANSYTKPYDIIPLEATEEFQESEPIKITPGYTCCYANQLRNGNIKTDLKFPQKSHVTFQKIIDRRTKGLYNCGENLLAMHHGSWTLYNSQTLTEMAEGRWGNNESTYFCYDSGFILFDEVLLSFSPDGVLLKKVYLSSGSDIMRHEVAMIGDFTISAGYLKASSFPDGLPGRIQPSGQLESFKMKDLEVPEEPDDILEPSESNLLAFVEEDPLIPVYLNDKIIQVLNNKIALISLELTIIKVIAGEFRPLAVSASEESIIYMTCLIDNKMVLVAFDTNGHVIFNIEIAKKLGYCMSPPFIASNGNVYWFGENGISVFNGKGQHLWSQYYTTLPEQKIYPLLYNDILTLCVGSDLIVYDAEGEILFRSILPEGLVNTPIITSIAGRYFIGMDSGLYEILFHQE